MQHTAPTIEQRVAMTILEEPIGEVTLDGQTYAIPAPTTGTLVAASALISTLPVYTIDIPDAQLAAEVLAQAVHARTCARIAATFILGAKRIRERRTVQAAEETRPRHWWQRLKHTRRKPGPLEIDHLTDRILTNCTAAQLRELTFAILKQGGLEDFFTLTTSLNARSMTRPTRGVDAATASGTSSSAGPATFG